VGGFIEITTSSAAGGLILQRRTFSGESSKDSLGLATMAMRSFARVGGLEDDSVVGVFWILVPIKMREKKVPIDGWLAKAT